MEHVDLLIKKLTKYVSFGQPVSSGSVFNQRISDPRIPISAYYMTMKLHNEEERCYHEVWLTKEGLFAVTEAWYTETTVTRKLLHNDLTYEQLMETYGEEEAKSVVVRMTEIISKSEADDWNRSFFSKRM
ncbi:hypothetical protein [Paenibacillus sp. UNC451MF]|uniref:hypothetical protein n=1 Tax=Paenibacillus sp. UNC451MF TaxID=1449063 RepID=UPI00048C7058|nr:hypothetical protein [Paenibacillus sp. UNC451MF]